MIHGPYSIKLILFYYMRCWKWLRTAGHAESSKLNLLKLLFTVVAYCWTLLIAAWICGVMLWVADWSAFWTVSVVVVACGCNSAGLDLISSCNCFVIPLWGAAAASWEQREKNCDPLIQCRTWKEIESSGRYDGNPAAYLVDPKYKSTPNVGVSWLVFSTVFARPSYEWSGSTLTLEYIHFVADTLKTLNFDCSMIRRYEFWHTDSVF